MTPPEDALVVGSALVEARRWQAALEVVGAGLARSPEDPRLLALLVRSLRALGRHEECVDAARVLLTVAPWDPYGYRLATLALVDVGWVDEAIGLAGRAVALDPQAAANHLALARAWAASQRPEASSRVLEAASRAVALDPGSVDARVQIGLALAASGDPEGARQAYLDALRLDPQHAAALNNLAVLDLRAGAPAAAVRHLAAALAADPQAPAAQHNLDASAVRVANRIGWWLLLWSVAAVTATGSGATVAGRVLALVALAGAPIAAARWWAALSRGQRQHLRRIPGRIRRRTWAWPSTAVVLATVGLVLALLGPDAAGAPAARAQIGLAALAMLLRAVLVGLRPRGGPGSGLRTGGRPKRGGGPERGTRPSASS